MPTGRANKPFDVLGFIFRYGVTIIFIGLFILALLVPLALKMSKPNYEVRAMLKIDPVVPFLITKSEDPSITGFYHDFVRTQARRINEYKVVAAALESLSLQERRDLFPVELGMDEYVAILQKRVAIFPVSRTHLVELFIQGPRKEGLASLLNAIMESYLEKMRMELEQKYNKRLQYLREKKKEVQGNILLDESKLKKIAQKVFSSTFSESFNLEHKRAVELQKAFVRIFSARVQAENAFKFEKKNVEELKKLSLASLVEEEVMDNRAIGFTSSWTYQQLQDMRKSIDGVTAENEDGKRIEARMKAMRSYEKTLRKETREDLHAITYGKRKLKLDQSMIASENEYLKSLENEKELRETLESALKLSGENSAAFLDGNALDMEVSHNRELMFRIDTRINELEAESRAPLRVTIEALARDPEAPAGSNVKKLLMACVAVAFGPVGFFFLLIEFFDKRIRSAKNIAQALGYPSTWPISSTPENIVFARVLTEASGSATAKAIRSLAARLFREHEENAARIFLFSGVDPQCGTSEITWNTAQALTWHSDKVLVIEIALPHLGDGQDGRNCQGSFSRIEHDPLRGHDRLRSFMPSISEQYAGRLLAKRLDEFRKHYAFICIDAPPILHSDLTEYWSSKSDAAVLISQGDSTLYPDLRRTAEIFIRLEIPALAPVMNWGGVKKIRWFDRFTLSKRRAKTLQ